ncbi:MAG TPA: proline dehydrogenase family protein [Chlamydiales bacterium]|jgi:RHH-type proline utilization regulon transcriptional repressor/proline dehydrogenase/delta 1-pyrroline-5-carboxylate dehydrogenase|nr:proline dehydrogenase family protein [Chlamydiales bacterium]
MSSLPPNLEEASQILESVKGQPQSIAQRKRMSIELAALMIREASRTMNSEEKKVQEQLSRLMRDPQGKAFTTAMTDECFRSPSHRRIADQMIHLLQKFGIPEYLHWMKKLQLFLFKLLPTSIARFLIPFAMYELRKQTARVILPGEPAALAKHIQERRAEGVRLNLNHLGEAILSEEEALARLKIYLDGLENTIIDYVSIKISTIYSQINLLSWDATVNAISERLKLLYRAAMKNPVTRADGTKESKFVNLDMEEYRDLHLTIDCFKKVLEEPEFHNYSAGIVLQAYVPDSYLALKELTEWAQQRVKKGGAWIKVRIVKGANLAMEQFEASVRGWPQAPYPSKVEVDANYKRMVLYGCTPENARVVRLGIASHNLFDIAFAMLVRAENQVQPYVMFEMLEGMADHIRRVVQKLTGSILLYCPVAKKEEFQHAIAYLIRRLDENTGAENFLRHAFELKPGTESWESQTALFFQACDDIDSTLKEPRRKQNRQVRQAPPDPSLPFENEPDTDFSLPQNRHWAESIVSHWKNLSLKPLPLVIGGKEIFDNQEGEAFSPNDPSKVLYHYAKANKNHIQEALSTAKAHEKAWGSTSVEQRSQILALVAQNFRERRGELIGAMMMDTGKIIVEADPEVSEAIDFAEYYRRQIEKMDGMKDIRWTPKGTVVVTPPWNFPCAIPAGGVLAALAAGNCVLLKPSSDAILVAYHVARAIWDAGVPKEVFQFVPCSGEISGADLITDERVNCVILTGGTDTAKKFLKMRPSIDLAAETGGKNSTIVTALADRDLAIKDLIQSAFGHCGQKCSATSLAILEADVYDDPHFLKHLRNAVESMKLGPSWNLSTKINPLIHEPRGALKRALTTLEPGESWLLEPKQDPNNPCQWSPGIKLGVTPGSFTHMTELFGPVLGLMRANHLEHAIQLANAVPFGLTAGLQSLDDREQAYWMEHIQAGNLYINRGTTGAIVRRQPFGGLKASSFGNGSKAGGPNYLREFMHAAQHKLPQEKAPVNESVNTLTSLLDKIELSAEELGLWTASISNYAYWWRRLKQDRDPTKIVGQDNFFHYLPRKHITLRLGTNASPLDGLRSAAAALTVGAELEISWSLDKNKNDLAWPQHVPAVKAIQENESEFLARVHGKKMERIRLVGQASKSLLSVAAEAAIPIIDDPVLANGRLELLHYLQEVSISIDYHRYGNLGLREGELRKPVL